MKRILLLALIASSAHAAAPTQADLDAALDAAQAAWGREIPAGTRIEFARLSDCSRHGVTPLTAQIIQAATTTTLRWDDDQTVAETSKGVEYTIQVNSSCKWDPKVLQDNVTHEVGHLLIGLEYHSTDKRSVMYLNIDGKQKITQADRDMIFRGTR